MDAQSYVSGELPVMHSRFGTAVPESMRPTQQELEQAAALPDLSEERKREIDDEVSASLRPRRR